MGSRSRGVSTSDSKVQGPGSGPEKLVFPPNMGVVELVSTGFFFEVSFHKRKIGLGPKCAKNLGMIGPGSQNFTGGPILIANLEMFPESL